ncbi:unnamed protein product [Dimorphilus gyrociliatus]|uniref:Apple domain-containing protein n=1 Tax=Dimorphilus gyrociliatus TaxID=2664684 RepID=A0A7I8VCR3_9ANNE|nr:unnamed protein product [Dimorphilus gyrociliatus]
MIVLLLISNFLIAYSNKFDGSPSIGDQIWQSPSQKSPSILESFDNIIHTNVGNSITDCAFMCIEWANCTGFSFEANCSKCVIYEKFLNLNESLERNIRYFEFELFGRKQQKPGINGAFYDSTENKYFLISGNAVLVYNNWTDFQTGPTSRKHINKFFTNWGTFGTDGLLVRQMFSSYIYFIFKGEFSYSFNKFSNFPAFKAFSGTNGANIKYTLGNHVPQGPGAMLERMTCKFCSEPNKPFLTAYFFKGSYIYEVWSETWMSWLAKGTSYHINDTKNEHFPGIIPDSTAALTLADNENSTIFFKGNDYYFYDMDLKTLSYLGKVNLC